MGRVYYWHGILYVTFTDCRRWMVSLYFEIWKCFEVILCLIKVTWQGTTNRDKMETSYVNNVFGLVNKPVLLCCVLYFQINIVPYDSINFKDKNVGYWRHRYRLIFMFLKSRPLINTVPVTNWFILIDLNLFKS